MPNSKQWSMVVLLVVGTLFALLLADFIRRQFPQVPM
jgi:hypothetical protein